MRSLTVLWNCAKVHLPQPHHKVSWATRRWCARTQPNLVGTLVLVLGCCGVMAAPPDGKGKPGAGNQPIVGMADFVSGDIISSEPLLGLWIDHGDFETLDGQLDGSETLTIRGAPGVVLVNESALGDVLPSTASVDAEAGAVTFSDASWLLRLDFDKEPAERVQLKVQWFNTAGELHSLDVGLPTSVEELSPLDYGEITTGVSPRSLTDATVEYAGDPFRIRAELLTGKGKRTEQVIYSYYYDEDGASPQDGTLSCEQVTIVP